MTQRKRHTRMEALHLALQQVERAHDQHLRRLEDDLARQGAEYNWDAGEIATLLDEARQQFEAGRPALIAQILDAIDATIGH